MAVGSVLTALARPGLRLWLVSSLSRLIAGQGVLALVWAILAVAYIAYAMAAEGRPLSRRAPTSADQRGLDPTSRGSVRLP